MQASGKTKKNDLDFYIEKLFNLQTDYEDIDSLDKLIDFRSKYLIWDEEIRQFFKNNSNYANLVISINRTVKHKFFKGELTGLMKWEDKKTVRILNILKEDMKQKIEILEKATPINQWDKLIQKKGDTFYYLGSPIKMGKNTIHYSLLDILLNQSDQHGFLSYRDIAYQMKKGLSLKGDTKKTITNAKDSLFRHSKINDGRFLNETPDKKELIEVVSGKGFKINNEKI